MSLLSFTRTNQISCSARQLRAQRASERFMWLPPFEEHLSLDQRKTGLSGPASATKWTDFGGSNCHLLPWKVPKSRRQPRVPQSPQIPVQFSIHGLGQERRTTARATQLKENIRSNDARKGFKATRREPERWRPGQPVSTGFSIFRLIYGDE